MYLGPHWQHYNSVAVYIVYRDKKTEVIQKQQSTSLCILFYCYTFNNCHLKHKKYFFLSLSCCFPILCMSLRIDDDTCFLNIYDKSSW